MSSHMIKIADFVLLMFYDSFGHDRTKIINFTTRNVGAKSEC